MLIPFDIAHIIEKYNISTFSITLSEWSIIPHIEAMNQQPNWISQNNDGNQNRMSSTTIGQSPSPPRGQYRIYNEEDQKVQDLIRSVEEKGKQKLLLRQEKERMKEQQQQQSSGGSHNSSLGMNATVMPPNTSNESTSGNVHSTTNETSTAKRTRRKTKTYPNNNDNNNRSDRRQNVDDMDDVYNGPCVICLEPNAPSQQHLQQLRHLLLRQLFLTSPSDQSKACASSTTTTTTTTNFHSSSLFHTSPTGTMRSSQSMSSAWRNRNVGMEMSSSSSSSSSMSLRDFRPVVPIAAFPNVNSAIKMAKQFRSLWKPLTFNVTDLHIISSLSSSSSSSLPDTSEHPDDTTTTTAAQHRRPPSLDHSQFGCDALITLMGIPLPTDDDYYYDDDDACPEVDDGSCNTDFIMNDDNDERMNTAELVQLLCEFGEPGGYYLQQSNNNDSLSIKTTTETNASTSRTSCAESRNVIRREVDNLNEVSRSDSIGTATTTSAPTELEQWLYGEDDEYDEGTVVVIGRTHFFTGEMRQYVGMPATSAFLGGVPGNRNVDDFSYKRYRRVV
jgi:hypothetical protein